MNVLDRLRALRRRERMCTADIVALLVECERTREHVDLGFSSVWKLLVDGLGYSRAAASRRYKAMRCALRAPAALDRLRAGQVTLTALAAIEPLLASSEDPAELIESVRGLAEDEVERLVARRRPCPRKPREIVRRRVVRPKAPVAGIFDATVEREVPPPGSGPELQREPAPPQATSEPCPTPDEERIEIRFSVPASSWDRFQRARAIVSRKTGRAPTVEECFDAMVESYLQRKGAPERHARRSETSVAAPTRSRSRHVPAAVRDAVLARDGERCTATGADGRRCTQTLGLQIDHVVEFACGGTHEVSNLRTLCAAHNRRRAELRFGPRRGGALVRRE